MPDLQGMIDTGSNSFWSLLLAIAVVGISLFVGRWVRRKVRRVLQEIEGLDEYAGARRWDASPAGPLSCSGSSSR